MKYTHYTSYRDALEKRREPQPQLHIFAAIFDWHNLSGRERQAVFERFAKSPNVTRALGALNT